MLSIPWPGSSRIDENRMMTGCPDELQLPSGFASALRAPVKPEGSSHRLHSLRAVRGTGALVFQARSSSNQVCSVSAIRSRSPDAHDPIPDPTVGMRTACILPLRPIRVLTHVERRRRTDIPCRFGAQQSPPIRRQRLQPHRAADGPSPPPGSRCRHARGRHGSKPSPGTPPRARAPRPAPAKPGRKGERRATVKAVVVDHQ